MRSFLFKRKMFLILLPVQYLDSVSPPPWTTLVTQFLERKVFLSLHVKVDEDWRGKPEALQRYGYIDSDFG